MTEKNQKKVRSILDSLYYINLKYNGLKIHAIVNADIVLRGRYPMCVLEAVKINLLGGKRRADWLSNKNLFVQMKYCSVEIRKIK